MVNTKSDWLLQLGLGIYFVALAFTYSLDRALPFFDWTFHLVYGGVLLGGLLYWHQSVRRGRVFRFAFSWVGLLVGGGLAAILVMHFVTGVPLPVARQVLKWGVALGAFEIFYHWSRTRLGEAAILQVSRGMLVFVSGWALLYALWSGGGQEKWMGGPFGNAGVLGNYLIGLWPYSLAAWEYRPPERATLVSAKWLGPFSVVLLGALVLALTVARAAWLGAGAAGLVIFWLRQPLPWRLRHQRALVGLLVGGMVGGAVLLAEVMKPVSALGRLHIFTVGTQMATQGFPLGLGLGQVYVQFNEFQALYFAASTRSWEQQLVAYDTYEVFNSALQVLIEAGLLGILFYGMLLGLIGWATRRLYRAQRPRKSQIAALGAVVGLVVSSGLSNPFHHWPILLVACWSLALLPLPAVRVSGIRNWGAGLVGLGIVVSVVVVGRYLYGARLWYLAATSALTGTDFSLAAQAYGQAFPFLSTDGAFLYNYGSELSVAQRGGEAVSILERTRRYYTSAELYTYLGQAYEQMGQQDASAQAFRHASQIMPAQLYPRYRLFLLYRRTGQNSAAWQVGRQLLAMPVKIPSTVTQEMQSVVRQEL